MVSKMLDIFFFYFFAFSGENCYWHKQYYERHVISFKQVKKRLTRTKISISDPCQLFIRYFNLDQGIYLLIVRKF